MRKFLALVLALVMTMSLVTISAGAATDFTDDATITNAEAVEVLNAIGILGGYADGSFRPNATLTRGAGAKLIAYLMLGQEAADSLKATYTVFADVTDTVGLAPYIEWAAANGIVGGYGDGNFGPYNTLTEYAFGKMLLTAIGFDADEQGYTGAGWQKAVYRDAIAKDIYTGTESYGACTRDTAAAMTLATLKTTYVVYGEGEVDGAYNINGVWYSGLQAINVTVNGVYDTELPVWATYDGLVYNDAANDKWGNIGERWIYDDEEVAFFEADTVATYTTQVDYCDLLVDLGISENSSKSADLWFVYNGDETTTNNTVALANAWVDEFDYVVDTLAGNADATINHKANHYTCDDQFVGGQGVLTKVFELATGDYLVTEVATYLAVASAPVKAHNKEYSTDFTVAYRDLADFGTDANSRDLHNEVAESSETVSLLTDAYAKDDVVLLTLELNDNDALVIDSHELAVGTTAKLFHYVTAAQASPAVGSTNKTADAFGFSTGYDLVKSNANLGTTYVFYHDAYGNVIGAVLPTYATTYAVLDSVWSDHVAGVNTIGANVVTLDAVNNKGVDVAKFNGTKAAEIDTYVAGGKPAFESTSVVESAALNSNHNYRLYTYSVADGAYTLAVAEDATKYDTITRTVKDDELGYNGGAIELTATTKFVLRDKNGAYTAVTGYNNLPLLTADYADVVYAANGVDAAIVYLHGVAFDGDKVMGYIVNPEFTGGVTHVDGANYYTYELYVDGAKREVLMDADNMAIVTAAGMYEIQFNAVDGLLAVNTIAALDKDVNGTDVYEATNLKVTAVNVEGLKISIENFANNVRLDLAKVYLVDSTSYGTDITVGELANLAVNQKVELITDTYNNIVAIYVILG